MKKNYKDIVITIVLIVFLLIVILTNIKAAFTLSVQSIVVIVLCFVALYGLSGLFIRKDEINKD